MNDSSSAAQISLVLSVAYIVVLFLFPWSYVVAPLVLIGMIMIHLRGRSLSDLLYPIWPFFMSLAFIFVCLVGLIVIQSTLLIGSVVIFSLAFMVMLGLCWGYYYSRIDKKRMLSTMTLIGFVLVTALAFLQATQLIRCTSISAAEKGVTPGEILGCQITNVYQPSGLSRQGVGWKESVHIFLRGTSTILPGISLGAWILIRHISKKEQHSIEKIENI